MSEELEKKLNKISTGPRVTLEDVQANISSKHFFTARQGDVGTYFGGLEDETIIPDNAALGLLTICVLVTKSGFTAHGVSACAYPENFNAEVGREIAERNAMTEIWGHMGYALRQQLFDAGKAVVEPKEGFKRYVGTKQVNAQPMTRQEYSDLRGWVVPADENPDDEGYLVEYTDGQRPNVKGFEGYVSWSPKDVFERAYR